MIEVQDALARAVQLPGPPRRIVSLVPSLTDLMAALGLDAETVGLTRFCVRPPGWKQRKTVVGGTKDVRVERVAALAPDLILAAKEENERAQVEALSALAPVYVTDVADLPGALAMIRALGPILGRAEAAAALAARIEAGFAELPAFAPQRVVYLIWRDPWMTVGGDTFIHDVLARGGLVNAFGARTRYPTLSAEELRSAAPARVLLSSEPYPFAEQHVPELEALLPEARVELVDGELFSWYGSRIAETPAALLDLRA